MSSFRRHTRPLRKLRETIDRWGADVERRYGISRPRQIAEILYFHARLETGPAEYYKYGLYDPERALGEKLAFLSQKRWVRLSHELNKRSARLLVISKIACASQLRKHGVAVPSEVGVFDRSDGCDDAGAPLRTEADLARLLRQDFADGLVFKPDQGQEGAGVLVFSAAGGGYLHHVNGEEYDVGRLHAAMASSRHRRFLIQRRLRNDHALARFSSSTLSTVRIVTCFDGGSDRVSVVRATYKLPVSDRGVDNFHAGSIAIAVDIDSGTMRRGVRQNELEPIGVHDPTSVRFEGLAVPQWESTLSMVRAAARAFPELRCLAWDVAITPAGPIVIEANSEWAADLVQQPHREGLWTGEFRAWAERFARR